MAENLFRDYPWTIGYKVDDEIWFANNLYRGQPTKTSHYPSRNRNLRFRSAEEASETIKTFKKYPNQREWIPINIRTCTITYDRPKDMHLYLYNDGTLVKQR